MKRILVPTDLSEKATNASVLAIQLAEKMKAEIHFIHLMSIPVDWLHIQNHESMYPEITKEVRKMNNELSEWRDRAEKLGLTAKYYIHYNESHSGILKYAESNDIDLIVMGSKGASGIKEILIGSNTERIVRHAKCPVLVVKGLVDLNSIKKIMLPSDLGPNQKPVAQLAKEWTAMCDAQLYIVKLNTHYSWVDSLQYVEGIESFATDYGINKFEARTFDAEYIEDGIVKCAEELKCELIIMGTHKRTGIAHIIAGSIAEDVSNHASRLVLTVAI